MHFAIAALIGTLAGAHASTWGMYKDAIHEGFTYRKYFRSILVGLMLGLALEALTALDLTRAGAVVVFFGLVYAAERGVIEVWKTFYRNEDQSKYFIPMQFHIRGRLVTSRATRSVLGAVFVALVLLILAGISALQDSAFARSAPELVMAILVGSIGGWIGALGGAWKDAPLEGFEPLKFFRSPVMTTVWAIVLAFFTDNYLFIAVAAVGYERASVETYKTFFFPSKPRGKFAGKPVLYPEMLGRRLHFVPLYVAIWIAIIGAFAAAFTQPATGLLSLR